MVIVPGGVNPTMDTIFWRRVVVSEGYIRVSNDDFKPLDAIRSSSQVRPNRSWRYLLASFLAWPAWALGSAASTIWFLLHSNLILVNKTVPLSSCWTACVLNLATCRMKHQVSCFRTVAFRTETISPDNARVFLKSTCLRGSGGTRAVQLPNVYLIPGISKEYRYFWNNNTVEYLIPGMVQLKQSLRREYLNLGSTTCTWRY